MRSDILTTKEAAAELGVSVSRILALIKSDRLPARRVETARGPVWEIARADLEVVRDRKIGWPKGRSRKKEKPEGEGV